ncbi:MAG: HlyC/CorC family transporter [Pirellulales bacterium]|nr:HlyC/CorC family transporter [Pirellulales bacterium]
MTQDSLFWLTIGSLVATCFTEVGARSLRHFSRSDLQEICNRYKDQGRFGEILRRHEDIALAMEMLSLLTATVAITSAVGWAWIRAGCPPQIGWSAFILGTLALGIVLPAFKIWLPWAITRLSAEFFLYHTWQIWKFATILVAPLIWGANVVDVVLHRVTGRQVESPSEDMFEEEIRTIVTEGHREGLLEEEAREMIEGVMELRDADVAEIMIPRTDMHMVQIDMPWDDLITDVIKSGHTRTPVYEKNRDDIVGILYSKDLLHELNKKSSGEKPRPLREIMRRPEFIPETKAVDDLLEMFQQMHTHIAIVLDEYGGVAGLVTIEDVLEEIVGEIIDEYDEAAVVEIEKIDGQTWEALGRAHVDEINELVQLDLPDDGDFDTIAGFVFTELGHIPHRGEVLEWNKRVRFTVLEATRRRIERVRIERLDRELRVANG